MAKKKSKKKTTVGRIVEKKLASEYARDVSTILGGVANLDGVVEAPPLPMVSRKRNLQLEKLKRPDAASTVAAKAAEQTEAVAIHPKVAECVPKHSKYFHQLLASIPSTFYFPPKNKDAGMGHVNKFMKNTQKPGQKELKDAERKQNKRARLDPSQQKTAAEYAEQDLVLGAAGEERLASVPSVSREELQEKLHKQIRRMKSGSKKRTNDDNDEGARADDKGGDDDEGDESKSRKKQRSDIQAERKADIARRKKKSGEGVVFNKLEFKGGADVVTDPKSKARPEQLLAKAERKEQKMASLRARNEGKADEIENKEKWDKAMQRSEGEKIKDDTTLLKKSIKREEKKKKKSSKEWSDRTKTVESKIKTKQESREKNLKERAAGKKTKKGKGGKKGKRPGF